MDLLQVLHSPGCVCVCVCVASDCWDSLHPDCDLAAVRLLIMVKKKNNRQNYFRLSRLTVQKWPSVNGSRVCAGQYVTEQM